MRRWIRPSASASVIVCAAAIAPQAVGNAKKKASPGYRLRPALGSGRLADDVSVFGELIGVRLGAQLVQQLGRSLDVGEEEGDGAGWEIGSHAA